MECPVCGNKDYKYESYYEEFQGAMILSEEHGCCERCGYIVDQAYSDPVDGFEPDVRRGHKDCCGNYHPKNTRKRARIRRKNNIVRHKIIWW